MKVDIERLRALYEKMEKSAGIYPNLNPHAAEFHIALRAEAVAILAELERGRRIEDALVKAMDTLNDFGAYARMCGRPPLANAARIAVDASLAALAQPDEKEQTK